MRFLHYSLLPAVTLAVAGLLVMASGTRAESPPPPAPPPLQREIWVPEKELARVLALHPKAILLSREKYEALIRDAGAPKITPVTPPPAAMVLQTASYKAKLSGQTVVAEAEFGIDCLTEDAAGWTACPLPIAASEIASLSVDGETAVAFIPPADPAQPATGTLQLYVKGRGPHKITASLILQTREFPGGAGIQLRHPQSTAASLSLELPARFDVRSPLPFTSQPAAEAGSTLHSFVLPRETPEHQIAWSSREISALAGGAVLQTCAYLYRLEPHRLSADLAISLHSSLARVPQSLVVSLPEGARVLEVNGADLLDWTVEGATLTISLTAAGLKETGLRISLESSPVAGANAEAPLTARLPLPQVQGIHRAAGSFALLASDDVKVRSISTSGLAVQTLDNLPSNAPKLHGFVAGFSFPLLTESPEVTFLPAKPRFQADLHTQIDLKNDAIYLTRSFRILVVEGQIFSSTIRLPENELVLGVVSSDGTVPAWKATGQGGLEFTWPDGLKSGTSPQVSINTRLDPDKWVDLDEAGTKLEFRSAEIPGPELITGYVGLEIDPQIEVKTETLTGLESSDPRRLTSLGLPIHGKLAWTREKDFSLSLSAAKRHAEFTAEMVAYALPLARTCDLHGQLQLTVRNSGILSATLTASCPLQQLRFSSPLLAEQTYDAPTNTWTLKFHERLLGTEMLPWQLSLPMIFPENAPSTSGDAARFRAELPTFQISGAERVSGSWIIEANTDTEVFLETSGLDDQDTLNLPPIAGYTPKHRIIAAYSWRGSDWKLALEGIRHQSTTVAAIIIDDLEIDSVLTPDGLERRQISCRIRANGTQFFTLGLPAGARFLTLLVDGTSAKPVLAPAGSLGSFAPAGATALRISLPSGAASRDCYFRVAYESRSPDWDLKGSLQLSPVILDPAIPVMQSHWRLHLPDGFSYRDFAGNMSSEFSSSTPQILTMIASAFAPSYSIKLGKPGGKRPTGRDDILYSSEDIAEQKEKVEEARQKMVEIAKENGIIDLAPPAAEPAATTPPNNSEQPQTPNLPPPPAIETTAGFSVTGTSQPADSAQQAAQQQGGPQKKNKVQDMSGLLPVDIALPASGRTFSFSGHHAPGPITFLYTEWRHDLRLGWIWILAGAFLAWLLARSRPVFLGIIGLLTLHFLSGFLGGSAIRAGNGLLVGWAAVCLLGFTCHLFRKLSRKRRMGTALAALLLLALTPYPVHAEPATHEKTAATFDVFVPFDSTKPLAEQQPGKFFIDYDQFQKLWQQTKANRIAENNQLGPPNPQPWVLLQSALYQIRREAGKLVIAGRLTLRSSDDWQKLPLGFPGATVRSIQLDQAPAPLQEGNLLVEKSGTHLVEVELEYALKPNWDRATIQLPRAASALLSLEAESAERFRINGGAPIVETSDPARPDIRVLTAPLGGADAISLERFLNAQQGVRADKPALAKVESALYLSPSLERIESQISFSFPGAERREFSLDFDGNITPLSFEVANLESWVLKQENGRSILEIRLADPVRDALNAKLVGERQPAQMPAQETFPRVTALASRLEQTLMLYAVDEMNVTLHPTDAHQRINFPPRMDGTDAGFNRTACFSVSGEGNALTYDLSPRVLRHTARADYLYQISPTKLEIHAAMELVAAEGQDLLSADIPIPQGFRVTRADSDRIQDWQIIDGSLHFRFSGATPAVTTILLGLALDWAAIPDKIPLAPLTVGGIKDITGRGALATLVGTETTLQFDQRSVFVREVDPSAQLDQFPAFGAFQATMPYEVKRAFTFDQIEFTGSISLKPVEPSFDVRWIMAAQVRESWVRIEAAADLQVKSGAMSSALLTFPAAFTDVKIDGAEVRDVVRSISADPATAEYLVSFHRPILSNTQITLSMETAHTGALALPILDFPRANLTERFFVAENASSGALAFDAAASANVEAMQTSEALAAAPFAIKNFSTPMYFKAGRDWKLHLRLEKLETTSGPKAVVTLCELTTALRSNGEEYLEAVYHLQNRSLQFLPLRLPDGMTLISVQVAGQSVRADLGERDGKPVLLIPLIQTRVGDLAMDIRILARRPATGADLPKQVSLDLDDPDLPGITIEKTIWKVSLPPGYSLKESAGNLETQNEEKNILEKVETKLAESRQLFSVLSSSSRTPEQFNTINNGDLNWREIDEEVRKIEHTGKGKELKEQIARQRNEWDRQKQAAQQSVAQEDQQSLSQQDTFTWAYNDLAQPEAPPAAQTTNGALDLNDIINSSCKAMVRVYSKGKDAETKPDDVTPVQKRSAASGKLADTKSESNEINKTKAPGPSSLESDTRDLASEESLLGQKQGLNYQGQNSRRITTKGGDEIDAAEIIRMQVVIQDGLELEAKGDTLSSTGDHAAAVTQYAQALEKIGAPNPQNSEARARAAAKYSQAAILNARELGNQGQLDQAKSLLNSVVSPEINPEQNSANKTASTLLQQLDDPDYFNAATTQTSEGLVQSVQSHFKMGNGYLDLGNYDKAVAEFRSVLQIDPYNTAARRQMEKAQRELSNYHKDSRDYTRAYMLNSVDAAWETSVPGAVTVPSTVSVAGAAGLNSLSADLATPGPTYYFQKVKANATLQIKAARGDTAPRNWWQLAWWAAALAILLAADVLIRKSRKPRNSLA